MRSTSNPLSDALAILLLTATSVFAQGHQSFDPTNSNACEKAVGLPEDDSGASAKGWVIQCASRDEEYERAEFAALRKPASHANEEESAKYEALEKAFESYRDRHLKLFEKGCGGGNGCPAELAREEARTNYEFLVMAEGFRSGKLPAYSASDYATADAALNAVYKRAVLSYPAKCPEAGSDNYDENCISRSEVRGMESTWIRYREAWVAFALLKWPKVPAEAWRTYLTLQRTKRGGDGISG